MKNENKKKLPLLRDFTKPELDQFRELCNFTEDEMMYFNLKAKDKSNVQIAFETCGTLLLRNRQFSGCLFFFEIFSKRC
jgi:hypothetical protein